MTGQQSIISATKVCSKCREEKPLSDFHDARTGKYGKGSQCKLCYRVYFREKYKQDNLRELHRARTRAQYAKKSTEERKAIARKNKEYKEDSPLQTLKKNMRRALDRHPTEDPVAPEELLEMWFSRQGRCAISGIVMTWARGKFYPTSISVDRIDCAKGYSKDNVRLVCYQVNLFRGQWSDEQMLKMARAIIGNFRKPRKKKKVQRPLPFRGHHI